MRNLNQFIIERLKLTKDTKVFNDYEGLAEKMVNYVWPVTYENDQDDMKEHKKYVEEITEIFKKNAIVKISKPMYGGVDSLKDSLYGLNIDKDIAKQYGFKMSDYKDAAIPDIQYYTKINLDDLEDEDNDNYILMNDSNLCYTVYGDFSGKKNLIIFYNSSSDYAFIFYVK